MPQVCVVIPAFQVTAYIKEAIESVLAQTYRDFEIILVNDRCPDTAALESVLEPYRSRITYLQMEKNGGPGSARNAGILAATSPYIALLDSDDLLEPNYLEVQIGLLEAKPEVDLVYCDSRIFGDTPAAGRTVMEFNPSEGEVTFSSLVSQKCNVPIFVTGKRELFLKAGLFEPGKRRAEDFDLWLRMAKAGGRIEYHDAVLVRSRRRNDGLSADGPAMAMGRIAAFEKMRKTLPLTSGEVELMDRQIAFWNAEVDVVRAKEALAEGRMDDAARLFSAASGYFKTLKLAVISTLARVAPRLLLWLHKRRGL